MSRGSGCGVRSLPLILFVLLAPAMPAIAQEGPYEIIERAYKPYMDESDPLGFPMKVKSIASDRYKFWRGTKDIFFVWCRSHCQDWLADKEAYLPNHGDLHLGNIGTYPSEAGWGRLAFGMVDFDDSATLPFQFELLQGLITLRLIADQNKIEISAQQQEELAGMLAESYRISVNSRRNATALLTDAHEPTVASLMKRQERKYEKELEDYVSDGKFLSLISSSGKVKEILRPAMNRADELAGGIASAIQSSEEMKGLFRYSDAATIRRSIRDAAQRTRIGSSGSQGLKKYFILLERPLKGVEHDVILYLKQEIPSAAERTGVVTAASMSPGERTRRDMDRMTDPRPFLNSHCEIGKESYWVTFKEPWSDEIDFEKIRTIPELQAAARIWGTVAGATHREDGRFEIISPRLTPALLAQISQRANLFLIELEQAFSAFQSDPRVAARVADAEAAIDRLSKTH